MLPSELESTRYDAPLVRPRMGAGTIQYVPVLNSGTVIGIGLTAMSSKPLVELSGRPSGSQPTASQ